MHRTAMPLPSSLGAMTERSWDVKAATSLLLGSTQGNELDLLAAQLHHELIAPLKARWGDLSMA